MFVAPSGLTNGTEKFLFFQKTIILVKNKTIEIHKKHKELAPNYPG